MTKYSHGYSLSSNVESNVAAPAVRNSKDAVLAILKTASANIAPGRGTLGVDMDSGDGAAVSVDDGNLGVAGGGGKLVVDVLSGGGISWRRQIEGAADGSAEGQRETGLFLGDDAGDGGDLGAVGGVELRLGGGDGAVVNGLGHGEGEAQGAN